MKYIICEKVTLEQKEDIEFLFNKIDSGSIYQMPIWSEIDKPNGVRYINVLQYNDIGLIGVAVLRLKKLPVIKMNLVSCTRGPVCTDEAGFIEMLKELEAVCRKYKVISIVIHPYLQDVQARHWEKLSQNLGYIDVQKKGDLHCDSLVVNLEQNLDEIFKNFRQTTRYEIKKADKFKIQCKMVTEEADLKDFYNIYTKTSDRKSFSVMNYDMLRDIWFEFTIKRKLGVVLLTKYADKTISGVLILIHGDRAVYSLGGSAGILVKGIPQNHITQWAAINWAKEKGCKKYDLGGIDPDTTDRNMENINIFKRGFSKTEVYLFRRHEKVIFKLIHRLVSIYLKIRGNI